MSVLQTGLNLWAQDRAADAQTGAADKNIALFRELYGQNKENLTPFMNQGYMANPLISGALGMGDAAGAQKAFDTFRSGTDYNFRLGQGIDAVNSSAATRGLVNSGANLKNITAYGQEMAKGSFNDWLSRLLTQQGVGLQGASALAGVSNNFGNQIAGQQTAIGNARAGQWATGANTVNNGINSLAQLFGGGMSSYGFGG